MSNVYMSMVNTLLWNSKVSLGAKKSSDSKKKQTTNEITELVIVQI